MFFDMACYYPNYMIAVPGQLTDKGKQSYRFLKKSDCYLPLVPFFLSKRDSNGKIRYRLNPALPDDVKSLIKQVPCHNCIGCRLEYSRQWAIRIMLECQQYTDNWFVTLTYDDDYLPMRSYFRVDEDTGESFEDYAATLRRSDLKQFDTELLTYYRRHGHVGIKHYMTGEYGSINYRPHYHICYMNLPIDDLELDLESSKSGAIQYKSARLEKIWHRGRVRVSPLNYQTASYVARYMLKKHKGKDFDFYERNGLDPEFSSASNRPGLARAYFDANSDKMYKFDELFITDASGKALKCKPVYYFDYLYDLIEPERLKEIKENRQLVAELRQASLDTDVTDEIYLSICEGNKISQIKSLKRDLL